MLGAGLGCEYRVLGNPTNRMYQINKHSSSSSEQRGTSSHSDILSLILLVLYMVRGFDDVKPLVTNIHI